MARKASTRKAHTRKAATTTRKATTRKAKARKARAPKAGAPKAMKWTDDFKKHDLFRIVAANVRDGEKLRLHNRAFSRKVAGLIREVISLKFDAGLISANVDITDYIGCLEEVCFGVSTSAPGDHPLRNGTPLLLQSEAGPWPPGDEWYSSVITFEYWSLLLPDEKWKELFGLEFKSRSGSRDTIVQEALGTLAPGTFRIKQGTRFGNPLVWLTPKTALENHLKQYGKAEKANAARDFLGLVHRRENHHLVAIHVPASVLGGLKSARPSFADAGGHKRFMAASLTFPFARAWGQTLNLEAFEISQNLADGGAERVCGYLTDAVTTAAEFGFTYLGQLTTSRGTSLDPTGKVCFGGDADYAERQVARDLSRSVQ